MQEIAAAGIEGRGLALVDVVADDAESRLGKAQRERQPHVTQADHRDPRAPGLATLDERGRERTDFILGKFQAAALRDGRSSRRRISTMRSAARPSHSSGRRPVLASPRSTAATACLIRAGWVPATTL